MNNRESLLHLVMGILLNKCALRHAFVVLSDLYGFILGSVNT